MESMGILLRKYIKRSGNTIYGIAKKADVNRTTLQKVLSEERTASQDLIEKIVPQLKLTPPEYGELMSVFEIQKTGENLYRRRQYLKHLLEELSCTASYTDSPDSPKRIFPSDYNQRISEDMSFHHGGCSVEYLLNDLILKECAAARPMILFNIPGHIELINRVFMHGIQYCSNCDKLHVKHMTYFVSDSRDSSSANLAILSNILALVTIAQFRYEVYYYYEEHEEAAADHTAFPYYIVFSDEVVLLSADCQTAVHSSDRDMVYYFKNFFDAALPDTSPLITQCHSAAGILTHLLKQGDNDCPLYSLEFQPCFATYLSEELLRPYLNFELPEMESLLTLLMKRVRQLQGLSRHTCIFSKSGLLDFTLHGTLTDIPSACIRPFRMEERIRLLEALYDGTKKNQQVHRMVNPVMFPISERLTCFLHKDKGLDFSGFNNHASSFDYIHITERTIIDTFGDFFDYLVASPLVYSKGDTLACIKDCIDQLKQT